MDSAAGGAIGGPARRSGLAAWLLRAGWLGIRPLDVGLTLVVVAAVELSVAVGGGSTAAPLDALSWALGALVAVPVILRNRWPLQVLLACSVLLFVFYTFHRRNISPAPLLVLPLYDTALAGYLAWAIVIPAAYMAIGLVVVGVFSQQRVVTVAAEFVPGIALLGLAILLGEVIRGRRALAAETAQRLQAAQEERDAEAARRVAEERLRIARDLHDTVAHSMATITVQAGSALHLLGDREDNLRAALTAIRETSKEALGEMRATLGQLRGAGQETGAQAPTGGLDRLPNLRDAVTAAGVPVSVSAEGTQRPLPPDVDHAAYRILQEALTNVLRHAGPSAQASVCLRYGPAELAIRVTDDGGEGGTPQAGTVSGGGHGLRGMAERAAAAGGHLTSGPLPGGGFEVAASLPIPPAAQPGAAPPGPGEPEGNRAARTGERQAAAEKAGTDGVVLNAPATREGQEAGKDQEAGRG